MDGSTYDKPITAAPSVTAAPADNGALPGQVNVDAKVKQAVVILYFSSVFPLCLLSIASMLRSILAEEFLGFFVRVVQDGGLQARPAAGACRP